MDIYEFMKIKLNCQYISDLHNYKKELYTLLKLYQYMFKREEIDEFCKYIYTLSFNELYHKKISEV